MTWPTPRLVSPDPAIYDSAQQLIADAIANGPRGEVRGPLAIWLHRPGLAGTAQALGEYCRYGTSLGPRLSELAILVTGRVFGSEYEWFAHKTHALNAGLSAAAIEAIRLNRTPDFETEEEQIVHDVARAVHLNRRLDDGLYAHAMQVLGRDRLVDLIGLLGYYTLISLTINVFGVTPPDSAAPELADD
jgi:4-carboxymuconolactone decarboxylase